MLGQHQGQGTKTSKSTTRDLRDHVSAIYIIRSVCQNIYISQSIEPKVGQSSQTAQYAVRPQYHSISSETSHIEFR